MTAIPAWVTQDIIRAGQRMDARGWVPATAGNISVRFHDHGSNTPGGRIAITRSGGHKGFLTDASVIEVDFDGRPLTPHAKPSAETLLHCQIYRSFADAGAVVHGHSVAGTVLSMMETAGNIAFGSYELLKAFANQTTHDTTLSLPLFANDQDMEHLARLIQPELEAMAMGYYIRGHGVYVWAADMDTALHRLEAVEFLLECELRKRQLRR
jgi:methylthioribulose-1-phosphate dehydratase